MRRAANITDRALRYRATANMPSCEKRCHFCGNPGYRTNSGRSSIFVAHVSGDESDTAPDNLTWTCRSCNSLASNSLQAAGRGRRTAQFNPASEGAANLTQWLLATACIVPHKGQQYSGEHYGVPCTMGVDAAVSMIRATPHAKRSEFARKIWASRKGRIQNPPKFERCVSKVKAKGGAVDPYAVCTAAGTRKNATARAKILEALSDGRTHSIMHLREDVGVGKSAFDNALMQLWREKKVYLDRSSPPSSMSDSEADRVFIRAPKSGSGDRDDHWYMATSLRHNSGKRKNLLPLGLTDVGMLDAAGRQIRKAAGLGNPSGKYERGALIKARFKARSGETERMWVYVTSSNDAKDILRGHLANKPLFPGHRFGQTVEVPYDDVLDYMPEREWSEYTEDDFRSRAGAPPTSWFKRLLRKLRGNPASADKARAMTEAFHGRPETEVFDVEEKVHYHRHVAELGELTKLKIKAATGVVTLTDFDGTLLCSNGEGSQLYLVGGDQRVDLSAFGVDTAKVHDFEDLGAIKEIRYYTTKEHLGSEGGEATYYHQLNEEDKVNMVIHPRLARLVASTRDHRLSIVGGAYTVEPEGIAN